MSERMMRHVIEEWMTHELRSHAATGKPMVLERQAAQHVIDQPPHPPHAPGGPRPDLRRHVVINRNARGLGLAGNEPVESGKIHEDDGIRTMLAQVATCLADQPNEL